MEMMKNVYTWSMSAHQHQCVCTHRDTECYNQCALNLIRARRPHSASDEVFAFKLGECCEIFTCESWVHKKTLTPVIVIVVVTSTLWHAQVSLHTQWLWVLVGCSALLITISNSNVSSREDVRHHSISSLAHLVDHTWSLILCSRPYQKILTFSKCYKGLYFKCWKKNWCGLLASWAT